MKKYKKTAGFTLIELLVVIVILGILAALTLAAINNIKSKARDARRITEINQMRKAIEIYYLEYGKYPQINEYEVIFGWSDLVEVLVGDGIISLPADKNYFSANNYFSRYLIPEALASMGPSCPENFRPRPQDPLCECKTPGQILDEWPHTYGYMSSSGQKWQYYKLRTQLENIHNPILQSGLTGDFSWQGDAGCNKNEGYYCVGNAGFVPDY